jgi:putative endonuclease
MGGTMALLKTKPHRLGRQGEETAARYLQTKGYCILERNVRTPHGEIDLIARKGEVLVFVEVKMRTSEQFGYPEEAVTPRKQAHLLAAAEAYLAQHPESDETWQFDVVAILRHPNATLQIEHFENVIR